MDAQPTELTLLLKQLANGNEEAVGKLIPLVYDANSFLAKKPKTTVVSATSTEYMDRLRSVGAPAVMMPGYGSVTA